MEAREIELLAALAAAQAEALQITRAAAAERVGGMVAQLVATTGCARLAAVEYLAEVDRDLLALGLARDTAEAVRLLPALEILAPAAAHAASDPAIDGEATG